MRGTFKFLISDDVDVSIRGTHWQQSGNEAGVWNAFSLGTLTDPETG